MKMIFYPNKNELNNKKLTF